MQATSALILSGWRLENNESQRQVRHALVDAWFADCLCPGPEIQHLADGGEMRRGVRVLSSVLLPPLEGGGMSKPAVDSKTLIAAARLSAKLDGCTCLPHVTVRELRPGVLSTAVAHDADCGHPSQKGRDA